MFRDKKRVRIGYNLSQECKELIDRLAAYLGLSQTAVIELSIREMARKQGIKPDDKGIGHE